MMFSNKSTAVLATLFLGISLTGTALACSTDGWDSATGSIAVGQNFGAVGPDINGVARFEELCAMVVDGTGHVQSNAPSHSRVRGRFYVFADLSELRGASPAEVLVAYSDEGGASELFSIGYSGANWEVDAGGNGGGSSSSAGTSGWNLIEFDWNPAGSGLDVWINADATTDAPTFNVASGGAATLESVRLGAPNGLGGYGGSVYFDSFEMHNETAIGPLFNCDAAPSGSIDISDVVASVDEFTQTTPSTGTPNCDALGGFIDISDVVATVDAFTAAP